MVTITIVQKRVEKIKNLRYKTSFLLLLQSFLWTNIALLRFAWTTWEINTIVLDKTNASKGYLFAKSFQLCV